MIILTPILILLPAVLLISFFTRQGITTSASIEISKPRQQVFDYLSNLKNQEQYNSWLMLDTGLTTTYNGTDGVPGFTMSWESNNKKNGKGSQYIVSLEPPDQIKIEMTFEQPIRSHAAYWFELTQVTNASTHINWIYEGNPEPHYFLRVSQLLLRLKKQVNKHMRISLQNVKNRLEHNL